MRIGVLRRTHTTPDVFPVRECASKPKPNGSLGGSFPLQKPNYPLNRHLHPIYRNKKK